MIAERNIYEKDQNGKNIVAFDDQHICQMADLTNLSIHDTYDEFIQVLSQTKGIFFGNTETRQNTVNEKYAIYYYPQALIRTNSNLPFFVASPKLFTLMNDGNDANNKPKTELKEISGKQVAVRTITINEKEVEIVKLGSIAEVNQGISTGQNEYYIKKNTPTGSYFEVDKNLILTHEEIQNLSQNERFNGVDRAKYGGKYFIPFDKGSDSNSDEGWMPNFYVLNEYYIDWSNESLKRMRNLTIYERKIEEGLQKEIKTDDDKKLAAALRNQDKWFKPTINFSPTGQYSPTFRLGYGTVSQNTSSTIVIGSNFQKPTLGILSSRFAKYSLKNFHNHTIHTQEGDVVEFSIFRMKLIYKRIEEIVAQIISKQKENPRYDYASYEQIEIDRLVYEAYGLSADDVLEVENWYARRYHKLSNAQKNNLRALGKSDDYLELYGLK